MSSWHEHIGDLYHSVLDNALWTQVFGRIMDEAGAGQCLLLCPFIELSADTSGTIDCQAYKGRCPFYEDYLQRHDDPWAHEALIERRRLTSTYYFEFRERSEIKEKQHAILFESGAPGDPPYAHDIDCGIREERFIREMLPHLRCALRIRWQMLEHHHARSLREEALDCVPQAMALLNVSGHVLFANRRAESIFQEETGPIVVNNRLTALDAPGAKRLRDALFLAARGISNNVNLGNPLRQQRWVVSLNPLHISGSSQAAITRILALIANLERVPSEGMLLFAKLYGLTPTETCVLRQLLGRQNTRDIATSLNISIKTLRTHLGNLFAKTSTTSQRELVQFFLAHPSV
ncbi:helix-turn-helix transcriptional regulator [Candidatus Methylospira mobilis]|uniref:Helix-turn-helix transcriptional regulator n=1 Tax=Candidatus Methylospira mobilis TaxID=1808979 RepID=A0A5Q0BG83_9GAMM|nr:helix-turn-helix transcriptional regulator [Candidatus Methylospira mobilis]QFY42549.1 helix-turn-helix transcriptional regulator [Candidatus Methylospira mobilis]WNV04337.1 helix-turn-helix transcriptional regulator [Candidatus Methylospira mobilis]